MKIRLFLLMMGYISCTDNLQANFQLSPVNVTIAPQEKVSVIKLTNVSDTKRTVQVTPIAFHQDQQPNTHETTKDLIVFPAMVVLEPQQTKSIQIKPRFPPSALVERCYRLYFRETTKHSIPQQGVNFLINMLVPVYVLPQKREPLSPPSCKFVRQDSQTILKCHNPNPEHIRLDKIYLTKHKEVSKAIAMVILPHGNLSYILPQDIQKKSLTGQLEFSLDNQQTTINVPSHSQ